MVLSDLLVSIVLMLGTAAFVAVIVFRESRPPRAIDIIAGIIGFGLGILALAAGLGLI